VDLHRYHSFSDPGGPTVGVFESSRRQRRRWALHLALFLLTLALATLNGGLWGHYDDSFLETHQSSLEMILSRELLIQGLLFSIPLLTILTCHEMGHYIACRRHRLDVSLPFFIPFPIGLGTLGAVIRIREPIRTRRQLIDIGAAGPIAGFVVLVPFLVYGMLGSEIAAQGDQPGFLSFGKPLLFRLLVDLLQITVPEGSVMLLHPVGAAAWFGMLITLFNLLPFAQLDGGHIWYALLGRAHRIVVWPLLVVLAVMGALWFGWWIWIAITLLLKVHHPPADDERMPLGAPRLAVALLSILIFILCFTPAPLSVTGP
jgi:membrane-associated protease RseP (regulator of RpoE activity)